MTEYQPKWKTGTFTTEALGNRIGELLSLLKARANADRANGLRIVADEADELIEVLGEYMRLTSNTIEAHRGTIRAMEPRFIGGTSDGCWMKDGKKYPTYEAAVKG